MGRPRKIIPKVFHCLRCDKTTETDREFLRNRCSQLYLCEYMQEMHRGAF